MPNKFVQDENETSKLFVSLLDIENDSTAQEKRREVWAKMHELSNGPFIHLGMLCQDPIPLKLLKSWTN